MRLINADALKEWLGCDGDNKYKSQIMHEIADSIDAQPTVCVMNAEHVRHGEWIKAHGMLPPEFFGKHKCSLCGHFALSWRIGHEELSNYCPNCGAKMDGGEQDANV